jgi:hypothetical protein
MIDHGDIRRGIGEAACQALDLDDGTLATVGRVNEAAMVALDALNARGIDPRMAAGMVMGAALEAILAEAS